MSIRSLQLPYGKTTIHANAPRECKVLSPPFPKPAPDTGSLIRKSIGNPINSAPLKELVRRGDKVAVVISDSTRASASHLVLPLLVEELGKAGALDKDIDIVVALGIHRRQTQQEHRSLVGDSVFGRLRISDHDADNPDSLALIGRTSRGTPVAINKTAADADVLVLLGSVIPHYFAGFGGGRKSVMPGICSHEANVRSHFLVFKPEGGRNPKARTAQLAGNPVHEDMLEAAQMASPDFIVNTVLGPDKNICAVFAGELLAAHQEACRYYLDNFSLITDTAADLTIVSCGGHPKDINFIQAHKAIHSAYSVTRPGGWMIVLAECADGYGFPDFIDWFRFQDKAEFESALRDNYHIYGQTAYAAYEKATSVNIILVSRLAPNEVERMNMFPADCFEAAYAMAADHIGDRCSAYVIPASSASLFQTEAEHREVSASVDRYKE